MSDVERSAAWLKLKAMKDLESLVRCRRSVHGHPRSSAAVEMLLSAAGTRDHDLDHRSDGPSRKM